MDTKRDILVVYYSFSGNTERVARDLAVRLGADLAAIHEPERRRGWRGYLRATMDSVMERPAMLGDLDKQPRDYALTVIGTPIWAGKMTPAVRTYLKAVRGQLHDVAFFATSGGSDAGKVVAAMEAIVERHAVGSAGFDQRILGSPAKYEVKLRDFIAVLRARRASPPAPDTLTPAHA
jgi:flavodoxin